MHFEGDWDLNSQQGASSSRITRQTESKRNTKQTHHEFRAKEVKLIMSPTRHDQNVTLDCVHKIHEALQDSYIVRSNRQRNAWQSRVNDMIFLLLI